MKKFLFYILLFIAPVFIIAIVFEILLRKIPNDYSYKNDYLTKSSSKIENIFLGSSHSYYGINPAYIKANSFNAAYISQSLNYDWAILQKYQNHWNNLSCIIIPIDYFSFYSELESSVESWRIKNYTIYYGITSSYVPTQHSELLSNTLKINLKKLTDFYWRHKSTITCSTAGWGTAYHSADKKDLTATGSVASLRHRKHDDKYLYKNTEILKSIIEYARARHIKVLLYTSPAYKTYVNNLDSSQLNETVAIVTQLSKTQDNTTYVNFLNDTAFVEEDYYDADHLNEIGAKKLTQKIDSLISQPL